MYAQGEGHIGMRPKDIPTLCVFFQSGENIDNMGDSARAGAGQHLLAVGVKALVVKVGVGIGPAGGQVQGGGDAFGRRLGSGLFFGHGGAPHRAWGA